MVQNTVQTLIDLAKDLSGLDAAPTEKIIRLMNLGTDSLSAIKAEAANRTNPDFSSHADLSRSTVTTSDTKLGVYGGDIAQDELLTFVGVEVLGQNGEYRKLEAIDQRDQGYQALQAKTGTPTHFDITGQVIRPLPVPDASYTYRLSYNRAHPRYSADDLTASTGLLPLEEEYVVMFTADKLMVGSNDPSRAGVRNDLERIAMRIEDMVGRRDQVSSRRLTTNVNPAFRENAFKRV